MLILGIESSCDESAIALLEIRDKQFSLLSEEISSQVNLHEKYGGVVPELASREHLHNLPLITDIVLKRAGCRITDISAVAVTCGPGLKGCLLMGMNFAKAIALSLKLPFVGVNHIEGHIHAARIDNDTLRYPFLSLVVSGGHTEIVLVRGLGEYEILSRTLDDAAGEAFDKSANLLGFAYPGGASLARCADSATERGEFVLPRALPKSKDFSFSGLKTAVSQLIRSNRIDSQTAAPIRAALCACIQDAIVGALQTKLEEAVRATGIRQVSVTGGVSANILLRKKVSELPGVDAFFPRMQHCTDNAAMIARVGAERLVAGQQDNLDLPVMSRWPIEMMKGPQHP